MPFFSEKRVFYVFWLLIANNGGKSSQLETLRLCSSSELQRFCSNAAQMGAQGSHPWRVLNFPWLRCCWSRCYPAAAAALAYCSGAPAQKLQKTRHIGAPLYRGYVLLASATNLSVFSGAFGQERRNCRLKLAKPPQLQGSTGSSSTGATKN